MFGSKFSSRRNSRAESRCWGVLPGLFSQDQLATQAGHGVHPDPYL